MRRRPRASRAPPSSSTSRTAVTGSSSPGSVLPLGSDPSSSRFRCTSRISGAPSGPGRQATPPAALISLDPGLWSGIGEAPSGLVHDQALLQVVERSAGFVARVPGPVAVAVQPPGERAVIHAPREQPAKLGALSRIAHPDQGFYPAVEVPVHHVRAAQPDLVAGRQVLARGRAR